jgi:hypothetical protein
MPNLKRQKRNQQRYYEIKTIRTTPPDPFQLPHATGVSGGVDIVKKGLKVFILGAGASIDFGFPSGMKLMQEIHLLWNHPGATDARNYHGPAQQGNLPARLQEQVVQSGAQKIKKLSQRLYFSGASSIDDFLSQCKDDADVQFGKLTILQTIFAKEKNAKESANGLFKWEENWLRVLFREEFCSENFEQLKEKLDTEQFYFVIFNYDRCVEHFLYTAIQNYYSLTDEEAKNIINKMKFYHVYGRLAPLGWQQEKGPINFGDEPRGDWHSFIPNIKIVNEDNNDAKNISDKIGGHIKDAGKVYILGFGFQGSNWRLLGIDDYKTHRAKGLAWPLDKFHYTHFGLSKRQREYVHNKLFGLTSQGKSSAKFYESKIYEFMHHDYT